MENGQFWNKFIIHPFNSLQNNYDNLSIDIIQNIEKEITEGGKNSVGLIKTNLEINTRKDIEEITDHVENIIDIEENPTVIIYNLDTSRFIFIDN